MCLFCRSCFIQKVALFQYVVDVMMNQDFTNKNTKFSTDPRLTIDSFSKLLCTFFPSKIYIDLEYFIWTSNHVL